MKNSSLWACVVSYFTLSFGRLRQKLHQKACRTCSTIICPHSTNHITDSWCCHFRCRRYFLNFLITYLNGSWLWMTNNHHITIRRHNLHRICNNTTIIRNSVGYITIASRGTTIERLIPARLSPFFAEDSLSFMKITDPPSLCIAAAKEEDVLVLTSKKSEAITLPWNKKK